MKPVRFYRDEEDFERLYGKLKWTTCPHCKRTGALILHGRLYGYDEGGGAQKAVRGRRVFCNNRKRRRAGCGRTFSVWAACRLKRIRMSAGSLWSFLTLVLSLGNQAAALRTVASTFSVSTAYRIWKTFLLAQSHLRTSLASCCAAPSLPGSHRPLEQTLVRLCAAFPDDANPIEAFQINLQRHFLRS